MMRLFLPIQLTARRSVLMSVLQVIVAYSQVPYAEHRPSGAESLRATEDIQFSTTSSPSIGTPAPPAPIRRPVKPSLSALQAVHNSRVPQSPWADSDITAHSPFAEARPDDSSLLIRTASTNNRAGRAMRTFSDDPLDMRRAASTPEAESQARCVGFASWGNTCAKHVAL